jgi:hypothetical protein
MFLSYRGLVVILRSKNLSGDGGEVNVAFHLLTSALTQTAMAQRGARAGGKGVECWHDFPGPAQYPSLPRLQEAASAEGKRRKPEVH